MGHIPVASPSPIPHFRFPKRGAAFLVLGAGFVAAIALAAAFTWPTGSKVDSAQVTWVTAGQADDLRLYKPLAVPEYRVFLVKLPGQVLALSRKDPKSTCGVSWRPDMDRSGVTGWFRDPCSGNTYDLLGRCFSGPCAQGMSRYPVAIDGDDIRVDVSNVIAGPAPISGLMPVNPPH